MEVNNANLSVGVKWTENTTVNAQKITDWSAFPKPANVDKMVLNLPVSETKYTKNEFYRHEKDDDSVGQCVTKTVRTLTFADGSTITGEHTDYSFAIKIGEFERLFGKSGVDMSEIDSAVEETWEYKERSEEHLSMTVSAASLLNGELRGDGAYAMTFTNDSYSYAAATRTEGTVNYKNGSKLNYIENTAEARTLSETTLAVSKGSAVPPSTPSSVTDKEILELFLNRPVVLGKSETAPKSTLCYPDLYEIVTGKSYDSTHISVDEALKKYPNVKFGAPVRVNTSERGNDLDILGIYKRDFAWAKAGVQGYSAKDIASMIGGIGKRLDEARKAGKLTEDEFAELNKSLIEYTEKLTERSERTNAMLAAGRENQSLLGKMPPQDYREKLNADIRKFLTDKTSKHYCGIDRETLMDMINSVRYSVLTLLPE